MSNFTIMTDEELWSRYAQIALEHVPEHLAAPLFIAGHAAETADAMLAAHKERWPQKVTIADNDTCPGCGSPWLRCLCSGIIGDV